MVAAATPTAYQAISPLIAVSAFGTQASAQTVCSSVANSAAAAGAAVAAQGPAGCVLPAGEAAPPPVVGETMAPAPVGPGWDLGTSILLGLGGLFLVAGIVTLFDDDDDDGGNIPISPV